METMSDTPRTAADEEDLEQFVAEHEAGIADVLAAYDGAARAYTASAGAGWPQTVFTAGSTTTYSTR